ncbi:MAG: hypothetical protein NWQ06_03585 [Leeuwenhoekiella sp.]|uniref:hypothetical protein n=1 Tax=Leeuwenhoekiella sp. MAR_2009_132 TaxID=1392489 RepID=UPI00048DBA63|nr:hypothetical protein [Leeuwenhoekiella sp. MAR_2009_132]MDP5044045.1 hypothetical protein [Leeuwenhoekiella sp.]
MNYFKTIALAGLIVFSSVLHANVPEPTNPVKKITSEAVKASMNKELGALLTESKIKLEQTVSATVSFTINSNSEVVVLDVETENAQVEQFIQNRLNYKKIKANALKGQTYHLPVVLESRL